MSDIPKITEGLNKFTPDLFARMGRAIQVAERTEFKDEIPGFKVWPSFWATLIGFHWENQEEPEEFYRIRRYLYLWEGAGFSSGLDPLEPDFAPAINLAEFRSAGEASQTYLGINVQRLRESTIFRQMPYINSSEPIVDEETGELTVGIGNSNQASSYFKQGRGPTVRMYLLEFLDENRINPATGEPFDFDETVGVYAFSATPMFDGICR